VSRLTRSAVFRRPERAHLIQSMQNGVELLFDTIELRRRRLRKYRCDAFH
jgi:hypothetical protein